MYTEVEYTKFWFAGCETYEDLIHRAQGLTERFKELRRAGVKIDESQNDGVIIPLIYPDRNTAVHFLGEATVRSLEEME